MKGRYRRSCAAVAGNLRATRSLLGLDGGLLTHGSEDDNVGVLLLGGKETGDLVTDLAVGKLDVVLGLTIIAHEGEETIVGNIEELVLAAGDVGDVHVVGGGAEFFELLAGEDVEGDQVDLGVTVLSSLGGRHVDDLAGTVLDDDETVLPQSRTLHGVGGRGASIDGLEGVFMLGVGHLDGLKRRR